MSTVAATLRPVPMPRSSDLRSDPAAQAFVLMRIAFTVAPILFGLDKFANVLTDDWTRYLSSESRLQRRARPRECLEGFDCLQACGLRDGIARIGQFCIDLKLAQAVRGDVERGLFFRGRGALPFGEAELKPLCAGETLAWRVVA